jgi:hypothetical protein
MRVKMGDVEIDYEGSDEFLKKDLLNLLKDMSQLRQPQTGQDGQPPSQKQHVTHGAKQDISTGYIAQKISAKTGTDLALAACYKMHLTGKDTFSTSEIISGMREAKSFFNKNYPSNLPKYLKTLTKSQLNDCGNNKYSLSHEEIKKAEALRN